MVYHWLGFIPQHFYNELKKWYEELFFRKFQHRISSPPRTRYTHECAETPGEIWAEDFSQIMEYNHRFYRALIIDGKSQYYLKANSNTRAGKEFVALPVGSGCC